MPVYFNGGTQPLVPEGRWGEGVIMPGERYETDAELGPPWVIDPEAEAATAAAANAATLSAPVSPVGVPPDSTAQAVSVPASGTSEPVASDGPELHELPNGDVVNDAGQVLGHIDNPQEGN